MKKFITIVTFGVILGITSIAYADDYTITTGSKKGTYFKVGYAISKMVPKGKVITSKGSVQNLDNILSGKAQVGLVQMDALAFYGNKKPEVTQEVEVIGPLYKECVYMAVNKDGKVQDEDDLGKKGVVVAVGKLGSGSAVSWDYMRQLETSYQNATVEYAGGMRALGKLASSPDSGIDAVMWVIRQSIDGKMLQAVMKNKNLKLISVDDMSLNNKYAPTGKPIYEFQNVDIKKGFFNDTEVTTICTDAAVVAHTDSDEDLLEDLSDRVLNYTSSLVK